MTNHLPATNHDHVHSQTQNEERWASAFDPTDNSYFSGNFPLLQTNDTAVAHTYYGSLMSVRGRPRVPWYACMYACMYVCMYAHVGSAGV